MIIDTLKLKNFRNYADAEVKFTPGINVIVGDNGVGKTNVVEAIQFLSIARSFRAQDDEQLINKKKEFATIDAKIVRSNRYNKIKVVITKSGKKIEVDGKVVPKISGLTDIVNVIIFEPRDVLIFQGLPKNRRQFLNISLSKKTASYLDYLVRYERLLEERNEILKSDKVDQTHLQIITEMLIKSSESVVTYRSMYLQEINTVLNKIYCSISGEEANVEIRYYPYVIPNKQFKKNAKELFKRALESDLKKKVTSIGPHREDFSITLNGANIAEFGSQGENRMMAIALKLAPYFLIDEEDDKPIVILDDVMSELDANHRQKLYNFLANFAQVFITATNAKGNKKISLYQVKDKKIIRRDS